MVSEVNMPKNPRRDKRGRRPLRSATAPTSGGAPRPRSVKELLQRRVPLVTAVTDQAARVRFWEGWLAARVAPELAARMSGVAEREDALVVFAESAAWCARLRFALTELEAAVREVRPQLAAVEVRVLPRS